MSVHFLVEFRVGFLSRAVVWKKTSEKLYTIYMHDNVTLAAI